MSGNSESGRPRRRAAAAAVPLYDAGLIGSSTRASRSSAAADAAAVPARSLNEDAVDNDATPSPSRSRSRRAGRPSAAGSSRPSRRQRSSSPNAGDEDEEYDGNDDNGDYENPEATRDETNDDDDETSDNFQPTSREIRPTRTRSTRVTASSQQDRGRENGEDEAITPVRPQRSNARRSASRPVKAEDAAPLLSDGNADSLGSEAEESDLNVRISSSRRPVRQKSQSSPLKALADRVNHAAVDVDSRTLTNGRVDNPPPMAKPSHAGRSARRGRHSDDDDEGWMEEIDNPNQAREVYSGLLTAMRAWLSEKGMTQLSAFMENVPVNPDVRYLDRVERPVSLKLIHNNVQRSAYKSTVHFEKDMMQLFRNARRYFELGSEQYGGTVALQRMYQHLTQSVESARDAVDEELASRNFASVRSGPCQEGDNEGFGESNAIGPKGNVGRLHYKGHTIAVGNWIHLSNPTDPARPIVAQVFRVRSEDLGDRRQDWITANWFLRPEQSRHPRSMMFWDNEVIKTSHMIEHHVEDVLEMICVVFYTKASRGRPIDEDGGWHTGDPLYICENRYQADRDAFFKIKNWASCLPEEVKNRRNDMIEYDQPITLPDKLASPFLRGVAGPGEIVKEHRPAMPSTFVSSTRKVPTSAVSAIAPPQAPRRRTIKAAIDRNSLGTPGQDSDIPVLFKDWRDEVQAQRRSFLRLKAEQRAAMEAAASAAANLGATPDRQTFQPFPSPHTSGPRAPPGAGLGYATPSPHGAPQALPLVPPPSQHDNSASPAPPRLPLIAPAIDRSLNSALTHMDVSAYFKSLPEETRQLFQQDPETGKVVWYPSPPIVGPTNTALQRRWNDGERFQAHSLDYMYHMASGKATGKRKHVSAPATAKVTNASSTSSTATQGGASSSESRLRDFLNMDIDDVNVDLTGPAPDEGVDLDKAFSLALHRAAHALSRHVVIDEEG